MASAWSVSWSTSWGSSWGSVAGGGTAITNTGAEANANSGYSIDPVSGFKMLPFSHPHSKLRKRWDGQIIRLGSLDKRHPQEFIESRGDRSQRGPESPESDPVYVSTSTSPSDL